MDKAEKVERVALVADDEPAEVAEPGEEAFNLPAALPAPQRAPTLGFGPGTAASMRRDHLDAQLRQGGIQQVGVAGAVADQALG